MVWEKLGEGGLGGGGGGGGAEMVAERATEARQVAATVGLRSGASSAGVHQAAHRQCRVAHPG